MKKNKILKYAFIIIISILVGILLFFILRPIILGNAILQKNTQTNQIPLEVTKENLPSFLASQKIINDLPLDSSILLRLYNLDAGNKNWEESYLLKKGKVEKGILQNPDITIYLNSKYLKNLGNICDAVKQAKANGDISYETKMSQLGLLWKYRKILGYKSCFGL